LFLGTIKFPILEEFVSFTNEYLSIIPTEVTEGNAFPPAVYPFVVEEASPPPYLPDVKTALCTVALVSDANGNFEIPVVDVDQLFVVEPATTYPEVGEDPPNGLDLTAAKFPIVVALVSVANGNLSILVL
jgi:hypothetical protein